MKLKTAIIQLNAQGAMADTLHQAEGLIRAAAGQGAHFITTPENSCRMCATKEARWESSYAQDDHPAVTFYAGLAKELGVTILVGSLSSVRVAQDRLANRSFLFGENGELVAQYDKIHLFDVDLPGGEQYRESDLFRGGDHMAVVPYGETSLGLSICYDVRFPHLYRRMAQEGAEILCVPSAFTVPTGRAHWETLLRARAIENGAFVVAPAQGGMHEGGRGTWGHSMIVSPWGEVLAEIAGDQPGYALADLDLSAVAQARAAIPSLRHDRPF